VTDLDGEELLSLLDGLPLALAQAASYLRETGLDVASYVQLYKQQWDDLMKSDDDAESPLLDYDHRSVGTTWAISLKAIEAKSESAAKLLLLWAFLDNKDLWHGLLQVVVDFGGHWPEWLREMASNKVVFLDAIGLLLRYSMIEPQEGLKSIYAIHPVVHRWTSHIQEVRQKREFLSLAVMIVGFSVPDKITEEYWFLQRWLLPHAERCSWWISREKKLLGGTEWRLYGDLMVDAIHLLGYLYKDQGKLKEAEEMYLRALEGNEKALSPDHTSTLSTVNSLGILYVDQGKLKEAEEMYLRALEGYEKALGPDHTLTLSTVNNLGLLYKDQGKLKEAEEMYLRALQGNEAALGPDHTSTLSTVNNLGLLYKNQGKLKEAEEMYLRALKGKEKALGPDHTSTLSTVNNLGSLYVDQGKLKEAEKMYLQALEGYEKALGPDHTSTLSTVNNLGSLYKDQGKLKEAEEMYLRALEGKEKALGPDHTLTLSTVNNLGSLYVDQGKLKEAEEMYLRALPSFQNALG
jgi:tetratricopeptide (TPR) repeat protein